MKKVVVALMLIAAVTACGQRGNNAQNVASVSSDPDVVNVYYMHGKQRCPTCIAMGDIAKATVENEFAGKKVQLLSIDISEKVNEKLVEKYGVVGAALIVAKGDNFANITGPGFSNALNNPSVLENLIKAEINKRLTN